MRRLQQLSGSRVGEPVLVAVILVIHYFVLALGAAQMGIAFDELFHIPAGYGFVEMGLRTATVDHPPLGQLLAGYALQIVDPVLPRALYLHNDAHLPAFKLGYAFFAANEPDVGLILSVARFPFHLVAVAGCLYVYLLARSLWGIGPAVAALLLVASSPLYLAWNRYVYLDGLQGVTLIASIAHLLWYVRQPRNGHFVALCLASAAALSSKYSGLVVLPLVVGVLGVGRTWLSRKRVSLRLRAGELAVWLLACWLGCWLVFGFPGSVGFYFDGMSKLYAGASDDYQYYLLGEFARRFRAFYLVLLAAKLTLPLLLLSLCALGLAIHQLRPGMVDDRAATVLFLLGTVAGFVFLHSWKALPIGARYLVPVIPLLAVSAAAGVDWALRQRSRAFSVGTVGLLTWHIVSGMSLVPDEMTYFNEAFGGVRRGIYISNDASLDAGQHLPRLARYLRQEGNPEIALMYQGTDQPERYGIRQRRLTQAEWDGELEPAIYVVSSYQLVYGQREAQKSNHVDWLKSFEPTHVIGGSLYIYDRREHRQGAR